MLAREVIEGLIQQGKTNHEIAEITGHTYRYVISRIAYLKIKNPNTCGYNLEKMKQMIANGMCNKKIADELGKDTKHIKQILWYHGIKNPNKVTDIRTIRIEKFVTKQRLQYLINRGMNNKQICKYLRIDAKKQIELFKKYDLVNPNAGKQMLRW